MKAIAEFAFVLLAVPMIIGLAGFMAALFAIIDLCTYMKEKVHKNEEDY